VGVGGGVTRRALIGGVAAIAVAGTGCATKASTPRPAPGPSTSGFVATLPAGSSDRDIAVDALSREQTTLAVYRTLARRNPAARKRIESLIAVQRRHVEALVGALGLDQPRSAPIVDLVVTPVDVAIRETAEHAARGRLADCRRAASGSLASMLASMAAAHQVVASQWAVE
jgi:hypothetical protein